jgi:hypothetical protein
MTKKLMGRILEERRLVAKNAEEERDLLAKLIQLKNVLERDRFEGLNRKVRHTILIYRDQYRYNLSHWSSKQFSLRMGQR